MKNQEVLFERYLLFASNDESKMGAAILKAYNINVEKKIVCTLEITTENDPKEHICPIIESLEVEVFNRIKIDVLNDVFLIIIYNDNYIKVDFNNGVHSFKNLSLDEYNNIIWK